MTGDGGDGLERLGRLLVSAGKDFGDDDGPQWAAAVAYYALLSLFPLLLASVSIAAYFVDPEWITGEATNLLGDFLLYRFVPRRRPDWQAALVGAGVAAALVLLARPLFIYYVQRFGDYNIIYGSLAIVVILIFWAFIVAAITILGGEIASHVQAEYYGGLSEG